MSADAGPGERARLLWRIYSIVTIAGALTLLATYVNAYDDYDVSDRLRALGRFVRQGMRLLSFPLGLPTGALADGPLERAFGCGDAHEPCAVFVDWHTHFAALLVQIVGLRWLLRRR
jgi:hypothetical protein